MSMSTKRDSKIGLPLSDRKSTRRLFRSEPAGIHRGGVARELGGPAGEVVEAARHHVDVDEARFEDRLAVVERLEARELVRVREYEVAELPEQARALDGLEFRPRPLERGARGPGS